MDVHDRPLDKPYDGASDRPLPKPYDGASERRTFSVPEAAAVLGIGRSAAYEACARGDLPSLKIGGRIVVLKAPLERMLNGETPLIRP